MTRPHLVPPAPPPVPTPAPPPAPSTRRPAASLKSALVGATALALFVGSAPTAAEAASTVYRVTATLATHAPSLLAVDTVDHTVYAVDSAGSRVSIFRGGALVRTLSAGADSAAIAVQSSTHTAYIANVGSSDVTVIRGDSVIASVGVGTAPTSIAVDEATGVAYTGNLVGNSATIIREPTPAAFAATTVPVGARPVAVAVDSSTHTAYVVNSLSTNVSEIDGDVVVRTVGVNADPNAIAVDSATHTAYVVNNTSQNVSIIDGTSPLASTVPVGTNPLAVAVDQVAHTAYVVNQLSTNVTEISGGAVVRTVSVDADPLSIAVDQVSHTAYVVNNTSRNVSVIEGPSVAALSVPVGVDARRIAVDPALGTAVVADFGDDRLSVISRQTSPTIVTGAPPEATIGEPYSFTVAASGTPTPTLVLAGALPPGITFDAATGRLAGTPTAMPVSPAPLTLTASNGVDPAATATYDFVVRPAPLPPTTPPTPPVDPPAPAGGGASAGGGADTGNTSAGSGVTSASAGLGAAADASSHVQADTGRGQKVALLASTGSGQGQVTASAFATVAFGAVLTGVAWRSARKGPATRRPPEGRRRSVTRR